MTKFEKEKKHFNFLKSFYNFAFDLVFENYLMTYDLLHLPIYQVEFLKHLEKSEKISKIFHEEIPISTSQKIINDIQISFLSRYRKEYCQKSRRNFYRIFIFNKFLQANEQLLNPDERQNIDKIFSENFIEFSLLNSESEKSIYDYFEAFVKNFYTNRFNLLAYNQIRIATYFSHLLQLKHEKYLKGKAIFNNEVYKEKIEELYLKIQNDFFDFKISNLCLLPNGKLIFESNHQLIPADINNQKKLDEFKKNLKCFKYKNFRKSNNYFLVTTLLQTECVYYKYTRGNYMKYLGHHDGKLWTNEEIFSEVESSQKHPIRRFFLKGDYKYNPKKDGIAFIFEERTNKLLKKVERVNGEDQFNAAFHFDYKICRTENNGFFIFYHTDPGEIDYNIGILPFANKICFKGNFINSFKNLNLFCIGDSIVWNEKNRFFEFDTSENRLKEEGIHDLTFLPFFEKVCKLNKNEVLIIPSLTYFIYFYDFEKRELKKLRISEFSFSKN